MTAVGFEPAPFRNGALNHRLRRLGQTVVEGSKTYELFGENRPTCSKEKGATQDICNENYRTHSSVGQSVWLITIRSPVQAWMGPLPEWKNFFGGEHRLLSTYSGSRGLQSQQNTVRILCSSSGDGCPLRKQS